jgi:hypothetical protein
MKKFNFSILFLAFLCLGIVGCSTEESQEPNEQMVEQSNLVAQINDEILNGVNYPNAENKYDYSAKNFENFLEVTELQKSSETKESYRDKLTSYYESIGYEKEEIDFLFEQMPKYSYDSYEELIDTQISNSVEKEILKNYLNTLLDTSISEKEFERITSIYENTVSSADFTEKEKRDMLTVFDMGNFIKKNDFTNMKYGSLYKVDQNIVCAGNIIVYMTGGAVLANGLGAVVGIGYGLWADYKAGCMD